MGTVGGASPSAEPSGHCIDALEDPSPRIRYEAVRALASGPPVSRETVLQIAELLKHQNPGVRQHACMAFEEIGPEAKAAIPNLVSILSDRTASVSDRYRAACALRGMGAEAAQTLPEMLQLLADDEAIVRAGAIEVLGAIGAAARPAVPALLKAAATDRAITALCSVQDRARTALARIGSPAVPSLAAALTHCEVRYRRAAAGALKSMTDATPAEARDAVVSLTKALGDPDAVVRVHAAIGVWNVTGDIATTIPILDAIVGTPQYERPDDWDVRGLAIRALGRIGPDANRAVPALIGVIRDKSTHYQLRDDAVEALGMIGPTAKAAIPYIVKQRFSVYDASRERAATAMRRIDPEAKVPIADVVDQIEHDPIHVDIAIEVLKAYDPNTRRAIVPLIIPLLKWLDDDVRLAAAKSLEAMGPCAEVAVSTLRDLQGDQEEFIRDAANDALRSIGRER